MSKPIELIVDDDDGLPNFDDDGQLSPSTGRTASRTLASALEATSRSPSPPILESGQMQAMPEVAHFHSNGRPVPNAIALSVGSPVASLKPPSTSRFWSFRRRPAPSPASATASFTDSTPSFSSSPHQELNQDLPLGGIFHEKQVGKLCALHCLNNLLQEARLTAEDLQEAAQQLDRAELRLTGGRALDYGNARKDGYFNLQVVQTVLGNLGYEVSALRGAASVEGECAFIINKQRHWFAIRKLGGEWFDLNSCLSRPDHYSAVDLQEYISDIQKQGYTIFVVRGEFPPSPLDTDPGLLGDTVRCCLRPLGRKTSHRVKNPFDVHKVEVKTPEKGTSPEHKVNWILMFAAHWFGSARFHDVNSGAAPTPANQLHAQFKRQKRNKPAKSKSAVQSAPISQASFTSSDAKTVTVGSQEVLCSTKEPKHSIMEDIIERFDENNDGIFDENDLDKLFAAETQGEAVEDESQSWPIFAILQCLVASLLWAVLSGLKSNSTSFFMREAGLESLFPGKTQVIVYENCENLTWQAWRWLSYQFTHSSFTHIGMNVFILLVAGIPLEGFQGTFRTFLLFNAGVATGAITSMVWNRRSSLVGMSAGCYSMLFVHFSEIFLNWRQSRFKYPKLFMLLFIVVVDFVNIRLTQENEMLRNDPLLSVVSHTAHAGGAGVGLLLGFIISRNLEVTRCERIFQAIVLVLLIGLYSFHFATLAQWPPQTFEDDKPWCWVRQIYNQTLFKDTSFHCVRCGDRNCIERWSSQRWLQPVEWEICHSQMGFWDDSN